MFYTGKDAPEAEQVTGTQCFLESAVGLLRVGWMTESSHLLSLKGQHSLWAIRPECVRGTCWGNQAAWDQFRTGPFLTL